MPLSPSCVAVLFCAQPNHNFIKAVTPHLVPVLLQQLTKQDEEVENDETSWNMAMASGTCLGLLARTAQVCLTVLTLRTRLAPPRWTAHRHGMLAAQQLCMSFGFMLRSHAGLPSTLPALFLQDSIVPIVMPFVTENIGKKSTPEDWHLREAATFAFGSILEGPSPSSLAEIVRQAMGFLLAVRTTIQQGSCHLYSAVSARGVVSVWTPLSAHVRVISKLAHLPPVGPCTGPTACAAPLCPAWAQCGLAWAHHNWYVTARCAAHLTARLLYSRH
jgi:hypothetical protein